MSHPAAAVAREVVCTFRSACFPLARLHRLPSPGAHAARPPVVLVHGFLGHPDVMRPLARFLLHRGWSRVVFVGYPSFGIPFDEIVRRIEQSATEIARHGPIDLVGHSLGAVACRAWLKAGPGAAHTRRFVALGAPFGGTSLYRFAPRAFRPALDPRGEWVERLREGPEPVPTTVIRARYDQQILPSHRASIPGVDEIVLDRFGHNGLLWDTAAHEAVRDALSNG